jgi:hypothetical protein
MAGKLNINVEHWWNDTDGGKQKCCEKDLL